MDTKEFLTLLKAHQSKSLVFEYMPGHHFGANYHITEVKNITVDSVDCGTGTNHWKETVIQLWESPKEKDKIKHMTAYKALGVLTKVNRMRGMIQDAEVKFEYGNPDFHTAQFHVTGFSLSSTNLVMKLSVQKTDCKTKEPCGAANATRTATDCAPGSGCC